MTALRTHEQTMAWIIAAQAGDHDAMEQLAMENIGLVRAIVPRFAGRGKEPEELHQVGCLGLVKAIRNFDVAQGVRFSTYAMPMILGEIRRFLRDDGALRVSRQIQQTARRTHDAQEQLRQQFLREPTLVELAATVGCDAEELALALGSRQQILSLDESLDEEEGGCTRMDMLEDKRQRLEADRVLLRQMLGTLPKRERQLILLRYFRDQTQVQTARLLGMTQVQVSRLESRILREIRTQAFDAAQ